MQSDLPIRKIVSGGQTGVDRAGLDVALYLQIEQGGWCPRGRLAEDGRIPDKYELAETDSSEYRFRTEQNVIDSGGTLILYSESMSGGTLLTRRVAKKHDRPCLAVDLSVNPDAAEVRNWIRKEKIETLNVAGPRESSCPGVSDAAREFLLKVLDGYASS